MRPGPALRRLASLAACALVCACSHIELEDCPAGVLGNDTLPRLRSSHYRMQLADTAAAANRFVPYALMSAYAYRDDAGCHADDRDNKVSQADADALRRMLATTAPPESPWTLVPELGPPRGCEDEVGLMFHVWQREAGARTFVVIAFRGTSGRGDWTYGNLWWFTRFVHPDNQLERAADGAQRVIDYFDHKALAAGRERPRYFATGHSLGGGLAQHVLYAHPRDVAQAVVFDPSSVTGFVSVGRENQQDGCACDADLTPEARILRVYESYEILSELRIFHKLLFPPERHVQEVRFPFDSSWNPLAEHSMQNLATRLHGAANQPKVGAQNQPWYASRDQVCTDQFVSAQVVSCVKSAGDHALDVCPR